MVKSEADVVSDFNELVNMTAEELDDFLKTEASETTGWTRDGGEGESVGHESGRKIVDILKRNPSKDASKYTDEDKEHMRKVVAYCKRHMAQEDHMKNEKTPEELEKTKSTRSLKNWGHDPLKTLKGNTNNGGKPASKNAEKPVSKKAEKPTSKKAAEKPVSQKAEKPISKNTEKVEKPERKHFFTKQSRPVRKIVEEKDEGKKEEKKGDEEQKKDEEVSKNGKEDGAKKDDEAEVGDKREAAEAPAPAEKAEKPVSKKAKTAKPVSEGTRKPPSRSAKEKKA